MIPISENVSQTKLLTHAGQLKRARRNWKPYLFIVLPTLLSVIYCFIVASPMFISESRFAIRPAGDAPGDSGSGGGKSVGGGGMGLAGASMIADGFALRDFIQSPDGLKQLEATVGFTKYMARKSRDPWLALDANADFDSLLDYYSRMVTVRFSMTELILILEVSAFSPEDAHTISEGLLSAAESFANQMNERSRLDAMTLAQSEVNKAEKRAGDARLAINNWRIDNGNVDPLQNIQMIQTVVGQLLQAVAQTQSEIATLPATIDAQSARRRQLESRLTALNDQVKVEQAKLTGGPGSVTNLLRDYERLTIELDFANRQLASAQDTLERARIAVTRQTKYITIISHPSTPGKAGYPSPLKIILTTLIVSSLVYAVGTLVLGMVRETHT